MKNQLYQKRLLKRVLLFMLVILVFSSLTGCGSNPAGSEAKDSKRTVIATSFYPMYIMTLNITQGITGVEVINLTGPVTGCLHDYQLTVNDLKRLHEAGILVVNGAGMESFMEQLITQRPDLKIIEASQGIEFMEDDHGEKNPHVWVSISLAIRQVQNIADQLASLDPDHADAYQSNAQSYIKDLEKLKNNMHKQLDSLANRDIVTFHEAFPYFAEEFGLNIVAVVEREPGSEPSAAELAEAVQIIRKSGVRAIFVEPQYSPKAADAIARETGTKVYTLDPAVTGPVETGAYLNIMNENLQVLVEALNKP